MAKVFTTIILSLILSLSISAQGYDIQNEIIYEGVIEETIFHVTESSDGFTYLYGHETSGVITIEKRSPDLESIWKIEHPNSAEHGFYFRPGIVLTPEDGSHVIALGGEITKVDIAGNLQWQTRPTNNRFVFHDMIDNGIGYLLVGINDGSCSCPVVLQIDYEGIYQWHKEYEDRRFEFNNVISLPNGNPLVTYPYSDGSLIEMSQEGEIINEHFFDREVLSITSNSLIQSNDGGFLVLGNSITCPDSCNNPDLSEHHAILSKFDGNINHLWTKEYGGIHDRNRFRTIHLQNDNTMFLLGEGNIPRTAVDPQAEYSLFHVTSDGDIINEQIFDTKNLYNFSAGLTFNQNCEINLWGSTYNTQISQGGFGFDHEVLCIKSSNTSSISTVNDKPALVIYPNPVETYLHFEDADLENVEVQITNVTGVVFESKKIKGLKISMDNLPNDVYFLTLIDPKTSATTASKVIVNR